VNPRKYLAPERRNKQKGMGFQKILNQNAKIGKKK
jgi:hypothetical protein